MPRRRYYYRRTSRPKQKWSINMVDPLVSTTGNYTIQSGAGASFGTVVCTNSTRIDSAASSVTSAAQVLKTGRWKFKGLLTNVTTSFNYLIYLAYLPEGYTQDVSVGFNEGQDVFYRHPEWVLAWTRKDYVAVEQSNEVSLTSRLKRNLNTGDRIELRVLMVNMGSTQQTINQNSSILRGTVSYCCRAN